MNDRCRHLLLSLIVVIPVQFASCVKLSAATEYGSPKVVAVFAGHMEFSSGRTGHQGARSASGTYEYRFNDSVLKLFDRMKDQGIVYKTFPASLNIPFPNRLALAEKSGASILIEIHHDSVQPHIYRTLIRAKHGDPMLAYYRGFSIHVCPNAGSVGLAEAIESQMMSQKIPWAEYHTEDIPGERMKLVQGTKAVYKRESLFILRNSVMPAVIIECGCIANPEEEYLLKNGLYRRRIVAAIRKGIVSFLRGREALGRESRDDPWSTKQKPDLGRRTEWLL